MEMMAHRRPLRRRSAGPNENHRLEPSWHALPTAVRELLDLQGRVKAELIFLLESHLNKCKADELRRVLNFDSMFVVGSDDRAVALL